MSDGPDISANSQDSNNTVPFPPVNGETAGIAAGMPMVSSTGMSADKASDGLVITNSSIRDGVEAIKRLLASRNRTWNDYRKVAIALGLIRQAAMREAKCNEPWGKRYCAEFSKRLRCHEPFQLIDRADRKRLLDINDNLAAIDAWRAKLSEEKQLRCNHPTVILRAWRQQDHRRRNKKTPDPVIVWKSFSKDEKRQILNHEGRAGLAALLSPVVLADLTDHVVGLKTCSASLSTNLAIQITKLLRAVLANETGAVDTLNKKLAASGRTLDDVVVAITAKPAKKKATAKN